ncbi:MAG: beta-lactamase family protein, partial [Anaerolineaceae bacterium]|nr:beta-lactamase family protein [Anaerolineaceae bacterium]
VDKLFASWDRTNSPGCALAVIQDGRIIYKNGYGMVNLEHEITIKPTSVFYIASTSQQFAATCIALLAEDGKLDLDDDVREYVPELPVYEHPITIRHLIHHTSGLRDYLTLHSISGKLSDELITDEDALDSICRQKALNFRPGEEYLYCNSGYFLLSVIVKRVSGKSMRQFGKENIFTPLGMNNTHFHDDHTELILNRATAYSPSENGAYQINIPGLETVGSGGIYSTVEDLYLWDQNFYDNKLGRGGKDLIEQLQIKGILNNGEELDYASGLSVVDYKGLKKIGHSGGYGGYSAEFIQFPEKLFSVICLSNCQTLRAPVLALQVADIFLDGHFPDKTEEKIENEMEIKLSEESLASKAGLYQSFSSDQVAELIFEDGKLKITLFSLCIALKPLQENRFRSCNAPFELELEFEKTNGDGDWILHTNAQGMKPDEFIKFEQVIPSEDEMNSFVGEYSSDELGVIGRIYLEANVTFLKLGRHRTQIKSGKKDMFFGETGNLYMIRDSDSDITGFSINAGRVRDILFERIK